MSKLYEVAGMSLYGWQGVAAKEFVEGKDYCPPENYYARMQYQTGWSAAQDSAEALCQREAALL